MYTQEQNIEEKKMIDLTISSPINVSVYYNSKSTLLMAIDLNSGINYDSSTDVNLTNSLWRTSMSLSSPTDCNCS